MKKNGRARKNQPMGGRKVVEVKPRSYQPTEAEKREVVSIPATPEQLAKCVLHPVIVEETQEP